MSNQTSYFFSRHSIHPVRCFPSSRRSHKFTRISYKLQVERKKGKCSYIQTKTILHITSLATASFVVDVNRSLDDVTDLLPRMHMPVLLIREKEISLRIHDAVTKYVDLIFQQSSWIDESKMYCIPLPYRWLQTLQ